MAFDLPLSKQLAKAGWKVKIRDKERLEQPHATIIRGTDSWRLGLRTGEFMDEGRWKDFPDDLRTTIEENWRQLCREWDALYPHNPVPSEEEANNGDKNE
ncbi:MAG: hypothetical protein U0793_17345 [Gemmataceae bacterium]